MWPHTVCTAAPAGGREGRGIGTGRGYKTGEVDSGCKGEHRLDECQESIVFSFILIIGSNT